MKNVSRAFVVMSVLALLGGCAEMGSVMSSDAAFSEKMKQIGNIVGRQFDSQSNTRAEAARIHNYTARDDFLEIDRSSLTPETALRGTTIESVVQYTVLTPNETKQVKVSETRALLHDDESFQLSKREVLHNQGTQVSTLKFTVPKDLTKGSYTLVTVLSAGKITRTVRNLLKIK